MKRSILSATVLLCLMHAAQSASILALFSSLSYSDHLVFRGYVSRLAQAGHSIVMMTPYPGQFKTDVEEIVELNVGEESAEFWDEYINLLTNTDDYYPKMKSINEYSIKLAIAQLKSKEMTALFVNPKIKFDLVVTEANVPILYGAAEKYQAPHISITTNGKIHQFEAKGNPTHPILYPDVSALNYKNSNIFEKITELNRYVQTTYEYYNNFLPLCDLAAKKLFNLNRDLQEIEKDIDLLFVAANPLLNGNRPSVPSVVYTDRLHIQKEHLSQELKSKLDSATKGVVYFSLGALQDSDKLSSHLLQTLVDAFRELPYMVLWKIANASVVKMPNNVVAQEWFPQQAVLAHPNVKVFLTHGGLRSLEEAVFYEVPILGLPIVKTRKVVLEEIKIHGAGEVLDPYYLEKDSLKAVLSAVVTEQKYKTAISKLKSIAYDELISGPENALWWTDYVLYHHGAKHLRSPAVDTSYYQYFMLDIISTIYVLAFVALSISYLSVRYILKKLRVKYYGNKVVTGGKFKAL